MKLSDVRLSSGTCPSVQKWVQEVENGGKGLKMEVWAWKWMQESENAQIDPGKRSEGL